MSALPPRAAVLYAYEEYRHERLWETYVTDMLWASAHGKQYKGYGRYAAMLEQKKAVQDDADPDQQVLGIIGRFRRGGAVSAEQVR